MEKTNGMREVEIYDISAGCESSHEQLFLKTLPLTPISVRFGKELVCLTICQKEHTLIRSLFEKTTFSFTLGEFTDFQKSHAVEVDSGGLCRFLKKSNTGFEEDKTIKIENFGTEKTPCFFCEGGFFVLCRHCGKMTHVNPRVVTFSDDCALLILGDDLMLSYNIENGFVMLGDFVALYQTQKSTLLEVCSLSGVFALYHIGQKNIEKLFEVNKSKGEWFDIDHQTGDIAYCDPAQNDETTGITNLFKVSTEGAYVGLF